MIQAQSTSLAVANGSNLTFNTTNVKTGCAVTQSQDRTEFYLHRPGIYAVEFNACGASTAAGTIGVQLMVNGTAVANTAIQATTGADEPQSISFYTLVPVEAVCRCTGGKKLVVNYTGSTGTLNLANIVITKLR